MDIVNSLKKKFEVASKSKGKTKFFAYCEIILFPLSILIISFLPLNVFFHFVVSGTGLSKLLMILSAASIGYLTNWIAITMLFRPYDKEDFHLVKIITLGFWKQGLIPENKPVLEKEIPKKMVENGIIKPKELTEGICKKIKEKIQDADTMNKLKLWIKDLLESNKDKIIEFGIAEIKKHLKEKMPELLSKKRITKYIHSIINFVKKDEVKSMISKKIVKTLQNRVPDLMDLIRTELSKIIIEFFNSQDNEEDSGVWGKIKSFGKSIGKKLIGAENISKLLINFINWKSVEDIIYKKISEENTQRIIEEETISLCDSLLNWLNTKEGNIKVDEFLTNIREKAGNFFDKYSDKTINSLFDKIVKSEKFYNWIEKFLQNSAPKIEELIEKEAEELNVEKQITNGIEKAIHDMNPQKLHATIDDLVSQHLVAIQVLGFILGGVIGCFQIFF